MQKTSDLYKELLDTRYTTQTRLVIGNATNPEDGYGENVLLSMETRTSLFGNDTPSVGNCVSAEITVEMIKPSAAIPKQARLVPYVRLTDGTRHSEWVQKGVFYLDTRDKKEDGSGIEKMILTGYDAMLKAEQDYPSSKLSWPAKDIDVVKEIAAFIGVAVDSQTVSMINKGYKIQLPTEYSCREVLGYIAAMYAGNFVMSDTGKLRLVLLYDLPAETNYLITRSGQAITFGGVRILV